MKTKITYVLGILSALTTGHAYAQSSVTLYGIVDASMIYTSNQKGSANYQFKSGNLGGSRWGLRGVEELGAGTTAVFDLENGFNLGNGTNGAGNREFGRYAFVGLHQKGIGLFSLGRQNPISTELVSGFFGDGFWTPATHIGDNDDMNSYYRVNNSVKFVSDPIYGFVFGGHYGFSNAAGAFANNRSWSGGASYKLGSWSSGVSYVVLDHPNSTTNTNGSVGGSSTSGDDYSTAFFYGVDGGVAREKTLGAGTGYTYNKFIAGLGYSNVSLDYNDGGHRRLNNIDANLRYQLTPSVLMVADYTYTFGDSSRTVASASINNQVAPHWHQVNLGASYAFSKRTQLFALVEFQRATGAVAYLPAAGTASSSRNQTAIALGMRNLF